MAIVKHYADGINGGGIRIEVHHGATGGDLAVVAPNGGEITVFAGGGSLLAVGSRCAAIAQGVNDGEQETPIFAGFVDYGTTPEGSITFRPNGDTVEVTLVEWGGPEVAVTVATDKIGPFGQACAAAGHDL